MLRVNVAGEPVQVQNISPALKLLPPTIIQFEYRIAVQIIAILMVYFSEFKFKIPEYIEAFSDKINQEILSIGLLIKIRLSTFAYTIEAQSKVLANA